MRSEQIILNLEMYGRIGSMANFKRDMVILSLFVAAFAAGVWFVMTHTYGG
jgi:hypothetical protein